MVTWTKGLLWTLNRPLEGTDRWIPGAWVLQRENWVWQSVLSLCNPQEPQLSYPVCIVILLSSLAFSAVDLGQAQMRKCSKTSAFKQTQTRQRDSFGPCSWTKEIGRRDGWHAMAGGGFGRSVWQWQDQLCVSVAAALWLPGTVVVAGWLILLYVYDIYIYIIYMMCI